LNASKERLEEEIVLRTAAYNKNFINMCDNFVLDWDLYRGHKLTVFACALRRMGIGMQSLSTIARQVRVRHVRTHSAYKDIALECARRVSFRPFSSHMCSCTFTPGHCPWHDLDHALRSLDKDGNAVLRDPWQKEDGGAVFYLKKLAQYDDYRHTRPDAAYVCTLASTI
jgi:hypothetical protein